MADATQGDTDVQYLGLLVPALITLIAGLLIHSFIIGVNVSDWWKGRSVTTVDHIVTSLGMSRMCAQIINTLHLFVSKALLINMEIHVTLILYSIYDFFTYGNFWLTSLLSIVLCLKISNFHSRLFLYLRRTIVHRTGYLIVASIVFSIFNCSIILSAAIHHAIRGGTAYATKNNLSMDYTIDINCFYSYAFGVFFPLLFYCISSVLLFSSLYRHTTKMKMSSNLSISLETYYSVMKLVFFSFIYNTLYFFGLFVGVFYYYFYYTNLDWLYVVLAFLPVLHSSYLIYRTAKLRGEMSKILQNVINFLYQRKDTETRENIEVVAH